MIREAVQSDLQGLLELYLFLHEKNMPEDSGHLRKVWEQIIGDSGHHIIVAEEDGRIVSSCVCVIIPNLTRNIRPYAFIENVVTDDNYRNRGLATSCLNYAKSIAKDAGCYKMMLLSGAKKQSTLDFYRRAGFNSEDKTAFIQWL